MISAADWVGFGLTGMGASGLWFITRVLGRRSDQAFEIEWKHERERLRSSVAQATAVAHITEQIHRSAAVEEADGEPAKQPLPAPEIIQHRVSDDRFAELLVEYYAYGLTQARSSFRTSQRFSGFGASILLLGIVLAIWRAETTGDLYLGIVTSSVGVVTTLIGQLFHRRADLALEHMAAQTDSLRDDMRMERRTDQAIELLSEVVDSEVKARLQAGLIMKMSGAAMPSLRDGVSIPSPSHINGDQGTPAH